MSKEDRSEVSTRRGTIKNGEHSGTRAASMRARVWTVAATYRDPADYDIPELPEWAVTQPDDGGIAFADRDRNTPFISAARPRRVRR